MPFASLASPPVAVFAAQVVAKLKQLQQDAETIVQFLSNESAVQQLKQDKAYNLRFLLEVRRMEGLKPYIPDLCERGAGGSLYH